LSFIAFTATTLYVGWRLVFQRSPSQLHAIAIWSCLFPQMVQGLQIDTDHWRHLYLLFGCLYGLAADGRRAAFAAAGSAQPPTQMQELWRASRRSPGSSPRL
jgi:hypothetical protein